MKKNDLKKLAIMGIASGALLATQAGMAAQPSSNNFENYLAGSGCGGKGGCSAATTNSTSTTTKTTTPTTPATVEDEEQKNKHGCGNKGGCGAKTNKDQPTTPVNGKPANGTVTPSTPNTNSSAVKK